MNKALKYGLWGFLFGSLGLWMLKEAYLLGFVPHAIATPFFAPGLWFINLIWGQSSSTDPIILTLGKMIPTSLFEGVLYAFLFILIRIITKKTTGA